MSYDSDNTELTLAYDPETMEIFQPERIMWFGKPQKNTITLGDGKTIVYFRIPIGAINPDGSIGDLVFSTGRRFSYGVQANTNDNGVIDGYSVALCMWGKDEATDEEKAWVEGFNAAAEYAKQHVLENKDEVEKYDLEASELKKFNPMYWKREKGKIVEGRGPTLYPKLLVSKKNQKEKGPDGKVPPPKILTPFYDEQTDEEIDPRDLIGKYCHLDAAVKIESIFVGARVSLQVKLHEATAKIASSKQKRLLKPKARAKVATVTGGDMLSALGHDEEDEEVSEDDGSGSLDEEEEEEVVEEKPKPKKKVVKKRVVKKRVVKKKA